MQGRNEPSFENSLLYRSEEVINDGGYEIMKRRSTYSTPDYIVSAWMCRDAISNCLKNLKYLILLFRPIYLYIYMCVFVYIMCSYTL
jgi:hypothetical protein